MKKAVVIVLMLLFFLNFHLQKLHAQNPVNWTSQQLMEPSALAQKINEGKNLPSIFSVGPGALIPHSIAIGTTKDEANLADFKKQVSSLPKDASIVIYCGCCPFEHCPNVRPAIEALKQMQFTNYKLLNLSTNLKTDWIAKGYPTVKQ